MKFICTILFWYFCVLGAISIFMQVASPIVSEDLYQRVILMGFPHAPMIYSVNSDHRDDLLKYGMIIFLHCYITVIL